MNASILPPVVAAPKLRQGSLSQVEIPGQSIANIGPTLTPAINITVVATIGMMFVAPNIGALARCCG